MIVFSIPMALSDLLPVLFFMIGARTIAADLKQKMNLPAKVLFMAGSWIVCAAGLLKALYKLINALGLGNKEWMSEQFFQNQAFGFLMAGVGLTLAVMQFEKAKNEEEEGNKACSIAAFPIMALVGIMVAGLAALDASLCYLAARLKKRNALVLFIINFFLSLGMGYLSSRNFANASMNWIAQAVNTAGQLAFLSGCLILHDAGLKDL